MDAYHVSALISGSKITSSSLLIGKSDQGLMGQNLKKKKEKKRKEGGGYGINWEFAIDIYIPVILCIK